MIRLDSENGFCAVCGTEYNRQQIAIPFADEPDNLDFRSWMRGEVMEHGLEECPHCGYVAPSIMSSIPFPRLVAEFLRSDAYRSCDGIHFASPIASRFYRYYLLKKERYKGFLGAWDALLHVAWACDDAGDTENARRFRLMAIEDLKGWLTSYENEDSTLVEEDVEQEDLILADLYRRTGQFDELLQRYEKRTYHDDRRFNSIVHFQLQLAREADAGCHTIEEAITAFPLPKLIYCSVTVGHHKPCWYITPDNRYGVGDRVVVDYRGGIRAGTISTVEEYSDEDAPYPPEQTKEIICRYTEPTPSERHLEAVTKLETIQKLMQAYHVDAAYYSGADAKAYGLPPEAYCMVIRSYRGDTAFTLKIGDDFILQCGEWQRVYPYPYIEKPDTLLGLAHNSIATRSWERLREGLEKIAYGTWDVILAYDGERLIGGTLMSSFTAKRSEPEKLIRKFVDDPAGQRDALERGFQLMLFSRKGVGPLREIPPASGISGSHRTSEGGAQG